MTIHYKILSVNDKDGSMRVRVWTDKLSEHDLRTYPIDREAMELYKWETAKTDNDWYADPETQKKYLDRVKSSTPIQCVTEYNLQIWNPSWTEEDIHNYIQGGLNTAWLELQEQIKDPNVNTDFAIAKSLVGKSFATEKRSASTPQRQQASRPPKTEGIEEI